MNFKKFIFPIAARAWFAFTNQGGIWYIPEDCRSLHRVTGKEEDKGKPCEDYLAGNEYCGHYKEDGKWVGHTLSKSGRQKKRQIEKYNEYRTKLFFIAKKLGFQVHSSGMAVYYHCPVPVRWTKKKKEAMHGQMKGSKPDIDNYNKGFFDALTGQDELIGQRSGDGKFWFMPEKVAPELREGYIEVIVGYNIYNPYGVKLINLYTSIEMEDILSRREKLKATKQKNKEEAAKKSVGKWIPNKKRIPKPLKLIPEMELFKKEDKIK